MDNDINFMLGGEIDDINDINEQGSNQVNFVFDGDSEEGTDNDKHWMFMENVRLIHERQEIEEEREKLEKDKKDFERLKKAKENELLIKEKQLLRQKELFDKQWGIVEKELHRISHDKERISKEKAYIERQKAELRSEQNKNHTVKNGAFFVGVNSEASLKKRYRELLKIYHPDSGNGDEATLLFINKEFESLKKHFSM
jgi:curved DNA-binding protein CbpA